MAIKSVKNGTRSTSMLVGNSPYSPIVVATGGNEVITIGSTKYHVFTSSGTFTVTNAGPGTISVMSAGSGAGG